MNWCCSCSDWDNLHRLVATYSGANAATGRVGFVYWLQSGAHPIRSVTMKFVLLLRRCTI